MEKRQKIRTQKDDSWHNENELKDEGYECLWRVDHATWKGGDFQDEW